MHQFSICTIHENKLKKVTNYSKELIPLAFVPYVINDSDEHIFLVNLRTDDTLIIGERERQLLKTWRQHSPDIQEIEKNAQFIQILFDNNFIASYATTPIPFSVALPRPQLPGPWLKKFRFLLVPFFLIQLILITIACILLLTSKFSIFPNYYDFFWTDDIFILFLGSFFVSYIMLAIHELSHFLCAKMLGIESRINLIAIRINQVVAETEHYYIYSLRKTERMMIYFSGIATEATIAAILLILLYCNMLELEIVRLARYIIYARILSIIWQMSMFFKTDTYNALSDYLKQENLYEDGIRYLELTFLRVSGIRRLARYLINEFTEHETHSIWSSLSSKERYNAKVFARYFFVGVFMSCILMVFIYIPRDIEFIRRSFLLVEKNPSILSMIKTSLVVTIILWDYMVLIYSYSVSLKKRYLHL